MKPFRNFSRQEPRKKSNVVMIIACMVLSLCLLPLIKSRYCPAPHANLQVPVKTSLRMVSAKTEDLQPEDEDDEKETTRQEAEVNVSKSICDISGDRSDTCEVEGDVRVQGSSTAIFINNPSIPSQQWRIRPYPRKGNAVESHIKEWLLKPSPTNQDLPTCTSTHSVPAFVFSVGGFTGNLFHDFTDVLVPVFLTSRRFHGEVMFVVSDTKTWWLNRFLPILKQLTNYDFIDTTAEEEQAAVHCFRKLVVGPKFHKELGVDPEKAPVGQSMSDFQKLLAKAYGLKRTSISTPSARPRLLIICRKRSRAFLNQRGMVEMAKSLGYDAIVGQPEMSTDLSKFARLVNTADVMIGVHGAGLTNMVFLPQEAVVIQVIPLGGLEWLARDSFKGAAIGMKLHYLEYSIKEEESTLIDKYSREDPVIKNPMSVHQKGWDALREVYLDKQDVRPHLGRLRNTLKEALKILSNNKNLPRDQNS